MEKETEENAVRQMTGIIRMEEAAITALSIYLLSKFSLGLPFWSWALLFFSPDISMLPYLVNTRIGALTYNLFHHRAVAVIIGASGVFFNNELLTAAGILLLSHSSFDRMMGYGLKFNDDFKHTSLGWIGDKRPAN